MMNSITPIIKQLIIINILFFVGTLYSGDIAYKYLSLYFPDNKEFGYWQLITHMFMHGNFMHIFFNMFALFSFGTTLESFWGSKKFLFFYISCGIGAALIHTGVGYYHFYKVINILGENGFSKELVLSVLNDGKIMPVWKEILSPSDFESFVETFSGIVVGASGAIYGVIVAFAFIFPNAELMLMFIPVPIKAKYFVPGLLIIDLFLGFGGNSIFGPGGTGVAHFAHVGGAVTAFIILQYWKKNQFHDKRWN